MTPDGALRVRASLRRGSFALEAAFHIAPGETLAIVGPSGAGKSTCLAAIAGLVALRSGVVALGDEAWCDTDRGIDWPPHRRRVGFVHQDYALFPHLSVLDNVLYGARARRHPRDTARRSAGEWIERLGLGPLAHRPVAGLSGGERQRVALARAVVSGAEALLLDEPFGSLDASTRSVVRRQLGDFLAEVPLPTVLVTHDPTDALALGDRIAILEAGAIGQIGTPDELLVRPGSAFVAELFGLNYHRAELSAGSGLREAVAGGVQYHVLSTEPAGPVVVAFPPSAVTLSQDRPAGSAQNTFRGTVREIVPLLERARVVVDCGVTIAADVVREAVTSLNLARGQTVWVSVKATAVQVFPP